MLLSLTSETVVASVEVFYVAGVAADDVLFGTSHAYGQFVPSLIVLRHHGVHEPT